jgi:4-hydroxy-tetrahydrodipicolinate synthase
MKPQEFQASLKGVICEVTTPFKENDPFEIDYDALKSNLRFLIKNGIKAVALTANGGECASLTVEERMAVWKAAVDAAKGKMVIIAGNGTYSQKGALELTRYGEKIGVDGFITLTPAHTNYEADGLYNYYKLIAEVTNLGILVYNAPAFSKVNVTPQLMEKLAQIPNIVGLQEGGFDIAQFQAMIKVMEKYHKVLIGMGETWNLTANIVSECCTGFVSTVANWWPEGVIKAAEDISQKRWQEINIYMSKMAAYNLMSMRVFKSRQHSCLAVAKEPMDMVAGVKGGQVRTPLSPLTDTERKELKIIIKDLGLQLKK